jgi:hypothetical protein
MNLLSDPVSVSELKPSVSLFVNSPRSGRGFVDHRRDRLVTNRLLITALAGLLAVSSAICTTMIELGALWRYSWLGICIGFAVMFVGIFGVASAIGKQEPEEVPAPVSRH